MMQGNRTNPVRAAEICDALGRRNIAAEIGVGATAVSNAAVEGRFPSRWYLAVKAMCARVDLDCPDEAFNFLPPREVEAGEETTAIGHFGDGA